MGPLLAKFTPVDYAQMKMMCLGRFKGIRATTYQQSRNAVARLCQPDIIYSIYCDTSRHLGQDANSIHCEYRDRRS